MYYMRFSALQSRVLLFKMNTPGNKLVGCCYMYNVRRDNIGDISYDHYFVKCNIDKMIKNGMQFDMVDLRCDDAMLLHAPLTITVNITDICNLNCDFCFYPYKRLGRVMTRSTINNIIKYSSENYVYEIDVLGGEPLCDQVVDSTEYLLTRAAEVECIKKIYVTTNALYPHNIERLSAFFKNKVSVSLSVKFGLLSTYNRVEARGSVAVCERLGVSYALSTVIDVVAIQNMDTLVEFVSSLKYCRAVLLHYPSIFYSNKDFSGNVPSINDFWEYYTKLKAAIDIPLSYDMPYAYYMSNSKTPSSQFESLFCSCSGEYRKMEILPDGLAVPCSILANDLGCYIGNINDPEFRYKSKLCKQKHSCNNVSCKFFGLCKVCHAYVRDNGEDERCPGYVKK